MKNKNALYSQIFIKTKDKFIEKGMPFLQMLENYDKVKNNIKLYTKTNKHNFDKLEQIKKEIKNNSLSFSITILRNEKLPEIIKDYFIISIIIEISVYLAEGGISMLDIGEYINGIGEVPNSVHKKILIADFRNLYIRKEHEQEKMIIQLIALFNRRNASQLYNILIIDENLKDLIQNNNYITGLIKNTILIK